MGTSAIATSGFIGRKPCLPARPVLGSVIDSESPLTAVQSYPSWAEQNDATWDVWWCVSEAGPDSVQVTDLRDWQNQIHVGQRWMAHMTISASEEEE